LKNAQASWRRSQEHINGISDAFATSIQNYVVAFHYNSVEQHAVSRGDHNVCVRCLGDIVLLPIDATGATLVPWFWFGASGSGIPKYESINTGFAYALGGWSGQIRTIQSILIVHDAFHAHIHHAFRENVCREICLCSTFTSTLRILGFDLDFGGVCFDFADTYDTGQVNGNGLIGQEMFFWKR
jgi:hypothetical protein